MSAECRNCSQPLSAKARFCQRCGAPTVIVPASHPRPERLIYNQYGIVVTSHQVRLGNIFVPTADISAVNIKTRTNKWPSGIIPMCVGIIVFMLSVAVTAISSNITIGLVGALFGSAFLIIGIICSTMRRYGMK